MTFHIGLLIFLFSFCLGINSFAQDPKCPKVVANSTDYIAPITYDEKYRQLKASPKKERLNGTRNILNNIFHPMLQQLRRSVEKLTPAKMTELIERLRHERPVMDGDYRSDYGGAYFDSASGKDKVDLVTRSAVSQFYEFRRFAGDHTSNLGRFEKFIYTQPSEQMIKELGWLYHSLGAIVTPVGSYGREFATKRMRTTQILMEIAINNLKEMSVNASQAGNEILKRNTARAENANYNDLATFELAPLSTTMEGIVTFNQLLNAVLAEPIPGVSDPTTALRQVIFNGTPRMGLTTEITARLPLGLIGPMSLAGFFFKDNFVPSGNGEKLSLSENLKGTIQKMGEYDSSRKNRIRTCPVAGFLARLGFGVEKPASHDAINDGANLTGIQILAETYWKVYQAVESSHRNH